MKQTRTNVRKKMKRLLSKWENSGMALKAFSNTVDVSYSKLKYWKYKLDKINQADKAKPSGQQQGKPVFIPVEIPDSAIDFGGVELNFPNKVKMTCPQGTGIEELKTLIKLF